MTYITLALIMIVVLLVIPYVISNAKVILLIIINISGCFLKFYTYNMFCRKIGEKRTNDW